MSSTPIPPGLIPDDLLELLSKGECVLFCGDDTGPLPAGDTPPGRAAFAARLAAKPKTDELDSRASHWEIAEAYQAQYGRHAFKSLYGEVVQGTKDYKRRGYALRPGARCASCWRSARTSCPSWRRSATCFCNTTPTASGDRTRQQEIPP